MKEEYFKTLSLHDLQQYYSGGFLRVKLPNSDEFQWTYIRDFTADDKFILVRVRKVGGAEELHKIKDVKWDFDIPACGNYNFKTNVIVFSRKPYRNPSKAITPHTAIFRNILYPLAEKKVIPTDFYLANEFSLTQDNLQLLFNEKNAPSFERGIEKIAKKQCLAYALDSRISLSQGVMSKHPTIWLKERIIGELNLDRKEAKPLNSAFIPELQSSFAETGIRVRTI